MIDPLELGSCELSCAGVGGGTWDRSFMHGFVAAVFADTGPGQGQVCQHCLESESLDRSDGGRRQ